MSTDNTSSKRSSYMNSYYRKNKERILAQRKRRYESDDAYREKLNEQRRQGRRRKSEPEVYQSSAVESETEDRVDKSMEFTSRMRVIHPHDRSKSCVCVMHTIKSTSFAINIDKRKLEGWLAQSSVPLPRYRNQRNWRLYTEYEVKQMELCFKKYRKKAKLNNYVFRLTKEVREDLHNRFKNFVGGIPPENYEANDE